MSLKIQRTVTGVDRLYFTAGAIPSLDQRFAEDKSLVDHISGQNLITFSRASSATFVGSNGVLQTAVTNAPRFDHNPVTGESLGLLVEEQRANLLLRSEEFNDAIWFKNGATVSADQIASPIGSVTAGKLIESAANGEHWAGRLSLGSPSAIYTCSIYAKAAERQSLSIFIDTSVTRRIAFFNLSDGTLGFISPGITSSIQNIGNGWYRCFITLNAAEGMINVVYTAAIGSSIAYLGDGTSGIFIWGAQLEAGAFPTSYIPTTTAAVTRAASLADLINSAIVNNIRSFYVEFRSPAVGTRGVVSLNDNTANERASLLTSGTDPKLVVVDGGVTQADIDGGTVSANAVTRVAVRIGANDFAICVNGGAVVTDSSGTLPTVDRIMLGRTQAGEYLNSRIARFSGWQQSLPNNILQSLTS